jgi:predicted amidohydrolase
MKIALAQMKMASSLDENYKALLHFLEEAASQGANLICYPELQFGHFFPQYETEDTAAMVMDIDHDYVRGICEACRNQHIMAIPNIYLRQQGRLFDASLFIDDTGKIQGIQKMVHIAQAEQFYEQSYYTPSDDGFHVFATPYGNIGIVVCFDRHYPESIRTEALAGADLIVIPTANTKAEPLELFEWEIRVQAFQNSVFIAMCNRAGREDDMDFAGQSLVSHASGELLAKSADGEGILYAQIDISEAARIRQSRPYTSLRRTEWYR